MKRAVTTVNVAKYEQWLFERITEATQPRDLSTQILTSAANNAPGLCHSHH